MAGAVQPVGEVVAEQREQPPTTSAGRRHKREVLEDEAVDADRREFA